MNLSSQVSSLELSQRLRELGVPQKYHPYDAYWVKPSNNKWHLFFLDSQEDPPTQTPFEHCRAFIVAELGEMLPDIIDKDSFIMCSWDKGGRKYDVEYKYWDRDGMLLTDRSIRGDTEADARAKMLIYLLEQGLIKV